MPDPHLKSFILATARRAGALLLEFAQNKGFQTQRKGERDLVTEADLAAEQLIIQAIREHYPKSRIHSEETVQEDFAADQLGWYIDPLDGTVNYSLGVPYYAVCIACEQAGEIIAGCVYLPAMNDCFYAERGQGAWLNDAPLSPQLHPGPSTGMLMVGAGPHMSDGFTQILKLSDRLHQAFDRMRAYGALAPQVCYSALYPDSAALFLNFYPWDIAASGLIASEAGNRVTDLAGNPWHPGIKSVLSAPPELHARLLHILA